MRDFWVLHDGLAYNKYSFCVLSLMSLLVPPQSETLDDSWWCRKKSDYENWGLHVWGDAAKASTLWDAPLAPAGFDAFGVFWEVETINMQQNGDLHFQIHQGDVKVFLNLFLLPCYFVPSFCFAAVSDLFLSFPLFCLQKMWISCFLHRHISNHTEFLLTSCCLLLGRETKLKKGIKKVGFVFGSFSPPL